MRELKTTDPNFEREIKTAIIEELDRAGEHRLDLSPLGRGSELKELELDLDAALAQFYRAHKKPLYERNPKKIWWPTANKRFRNSVQSWLKKTKKTLLF